MRLRLRPNGADSVTLVAPEDADIRAAGRRRLRPADRPHGAKRTTITLRCFGRSCDGLAIDVVIGKPQPVEFIVLGSRSGPARRAPAPLVARAGPTSPAAIFAGLDHRA